MVATNTTTSPQLDDHQRLILQEAHIYTAIPYGFDNDDDDENEEFSFEQEQNEDRNDTTSTTSTTSTITSTFQFYSCCMGWLVGVFIQFSSLGSSNFFPNIKYFSWIWSFITSTNGILLLFVLRALIGAVYNNNSNNKNNSNNNKFWNQAISMEMSYAIGTLFGICMAWMGTDYILGLPQVLESAIILLIGTIFFNIVSKYVYQKLDADENDDNDDDKTTPLLSSSSSSSLSDVEEEGLLQHQGQKSMLLPVKCWSLGLGSLVGLFIQFSSLGCNFVLQEIFITKYDNEEELSSSIDIDLDENNDQILLWSLGWSLLTSTMGIAILLLARILLLQFVPMTSTTILLHVECYFAIGATIGLNIAWMITDILMKLDSHIVQSITTLAVTLLWCRGVLYCSNKCQQQQHNTYYEENTDELQDNIDEISVV